MVILSGTLRRARRPLLLGSYAHDVKPPFKEREQVQESALKRPPLHLGKLLTFVPAKTE
jgi:hypothetical protein